MITVHEAKGTVSKSKVWMQVVDLGENGGVP